MLMFHWFWTQATFGFTGISCLRGAISQTAFSSCEQHVENRGPRQPRP